MKILKSPLPEKVHLSKTTAGNVFPKVGGKLTLRYKTNGEKKVKITCSQDAYSVLKNLYCPDTVEYQETAVVLFLNRINNTIGWMKVSTGGQAGTVIDGKIVFAAALQCGASGIILSHNHPSGETKPSNSDIHLTKCLVEIGKYMDLQVLDHLIITFTTYYSFADEGKL